MSAFTGFPESLLTFYEGLAADNSKAFWTDHRPVYDEQIAPSMRALCDRLGPEFGEAKVFRPYRDVRFSADKSPYKTTIAAALGEGTGVLYVQVWAEGLLAAGGAYRMEPAQLERYRRAVDDERAGGELVTVVEGLRAAGLVIGGEVMKTRPRGVAPDHPRLDLLRHRSLTAARNWLPEPWLHTAVAADRVAEVWRSVGPLNAWLDRHVGS